MSTNAQCPPIVNVNNDNDNGNWRESRAGRGFGLALALVDIGGNGRWWTMAEAAGGGGLCGRNRGLRRRKYRAARPKSIPPRHFPHFPTISGKTARAAHPHRAGGIGKAAASRGRSDSTVRETHTIVRSGSGDFNQNHARWNRLRDLRAARNDSHRVRLRLRRREQVFQRVGGGVQMETFAVP